MDKFLITASVCHPQFKTAWIKNEVKKQMASECLKNACNEVHHNNSENDSVESAHTNDNVSSFFSWSQNFNKQKSAISDEIDRFLGTSPSKTIECLHNLPTIKKVRLI